MIMQLPGQLDLLGLLADPAPVNDPFYRCKCGSEFPCSAPMAELAVWAERHREHEAEFSAAQWPAGVCAHCGEMYWIPTERPYWTFERLRDEHREVEPGVCGRMAEARDMHEQYSTGRKVPEPHWSRADLRNWIAELAAHRGRAWKIYNERST